MKFLLVLAVVVIAFYLWRNNREAERRDGEAARPRKPSQDKPQDMVRCPVCALHLPRSDAIAGQRGDYCSDEHRTQAEG